MTYVAIVEREGAGWGAYVPDLPGCVAVAESRERAEALIRAAVAAHVAHMRERGEAIPPPSTTALAVETAS